MNPQTKVAAAHSDEEMFVLGGTVSILYVTDGTVNLLQGMQSKMAAAGLGSALAGMAGGVANASMVTMYDGEYVQHFGCYAGEQMLIGTFPSVGFKEGDEIKAVVTRLDEHVVFAHAVVRPSDGRLWMPHSIAKGRYAIAAWMAKLMGCICMFAWISLSVVQLASPIDDSYLSLIGWMVPGMLAVSFLIGFPAYRSSLGEGLYAERILKVLGFKSPKIVNLSPFSLAGLRVGSSHMVYDLRRALKAYGSLSKPASAPEKKR